MCHKSVKFLTRKSACVNFLTNVMFVCCCHEWMRTLVLQSIRACGCYWSRSRRPRLAWRGANLLLEPFSKRSNKNRQLKQYVDNM